MLLYKLPECLTGEQRLSIAMGAGTLSYIDPNVSLARQWIGGFNQFIDVGEVPNYMRQSSPMTGKTLSVQ